MRSIIFMLKPQIKRGETCSLTAKSKEVSNHDKTVLIVLTHLLITNKRYSALRSATYSRARGPWIPPAEKNYVE